MSARALWQFRHGEDDQRPYKHLWANVLWQAVLDTVRFARATRPTPCAIRADAQEWFASDEVYVGSFVWVCELMRLDPGCVRVKVAEMAEKCDSGELESMPRFIVQMV